MTCERAWILSSLWHCRPRSTFPVLCVGVGYDWIHDVEEQAKAWRWHWVGYPNDGYSSPPTLEAFPCSGAKPG